MRSDRSEPVPAAAEQPDVLTKLTGQVDEFESRKVSVGEIHAPCLIMLFVLLSVAYTHRVS